jgi:hypothetical protein
LNKKKEWSYAGLLSVLGYIQFIWNEMDEALQNNKTSEDALMSNNQQS